MTKKKSSNLMNYAGTFGALVILCVVLAIASPNFFKYSNMMSILKQTSFNALVSTGIRTFNSDIHSLNRLISYILKLTLQENAVISVVLCECIGM